MIYLCKLKRYKKKRKGYKKKRKEYKKEKNMTHNEILVYLQNTTTTQTIIYCFSNIDDNYNYPINPKNASFRILGQENFLNMFIAIYDCLNMVKYGNAVMDTLNPNSSIIFTKTSISDTINIVNEIYQNYIRKGYISNSSIIRNIIEEKSEKNEIK